MRQKNNRLLIIFSVFVLCSSFILLEGDKPVFYIIGDSTVRNGDGSGRNLQWGWGSFIDEYFDTSKISVRNLAIGGRSSRTFITEGRWDQILSRLKKGDYVIMQFGHNDGGPLDDTARARGTIRGIGNDSQEVYNPIRKVREVVHSYGWYMRKYVQEAKAKGAIPIVCSPIPRNDWKDGKVVQSPESYTGWAQKIAQEEGAHFINLNQLIAAKYESLGPDSVKKFFPADHTHTNLQGALINAEIVMNEVKRLNPGKVNKYLLPKKRLEERAVVLNAMQKTNNYFMAKWPDPGQVTNVGRVRPSNLWTRAVYYEGLMALYKLQPDTTCYNYAVHWGEFHKWGLWGGTGVRNADNQCCGQTYIDLFYIDRKPERVRDIKTCIDSMKMTAKIDDWHWVDAIQMAMPVFTKLGVLYNDTSYFNRMYDMYAFTRNKHGDKGLYNPVDHLWWRDKDFDPPYKEPNGKNCYWSRGNGWVVAALVRVMSQLPKTDPHYGEYLQDYKDMMAALLPIQRKDGFWNVSLHDPDHFGGKELTGTSLFVYGMAWGINNNILDRKKYLPALTKAWNALVQDCVHEDGKLGWVQSTGKEPKDGQPVSYDKIPDFEDYGLGCFLLGMSEVYRMQ